jgi:hypothetical protein
VKNCGRDGTPGSDTTSIWNTSLSTLMAAVVTASPDWNTRCHTPGGPDPSIMLNDARPIDDVRADGSSMTGRQMSAYRAPMSV